MSDQIVLFMSTHESPGDVFALALAAMTQLGDKLGPPRRPYAYEEAYNDVLIVTVGAHHHRARILGSTRVFELTVFFGFTNLERWQDAWNGMLDITMHVLSSFEGDAALLYDWRVVLARLNGAIYLDNDRKLGFWAEPTHLLHVTLPYEFKRVPIEALPDRLEHSRPKVRLRRKKG